MRPHVKRGGAWVDPNPPTRVYRRRVDRDAAAGTSNAGHDRGAARAPVDLLSPSSGTQLPFRAPDSAIPPRGGAVGPPVDPPSPSPDEEPPSDPSPHGALAPTAHPSPHRLSSTAAVSTPPHRRGLWRPKQQDSPHSPADTDSPGHIVHARQRLPDFPAASTPQAHAAGPAAAASSATPRGGTPSTPSPESALRSAPPPPLSAPARRVTPPLRSSAPSCSGTPPSSGCGSPSPTHLHSSSGGPTCAGSGSTASSDSTKSYASLFQSEDSEKTDAKLVSEFYDFLTKFTLGSAKFAYYKAQVAALKLQGNFELCIQFKHMLAYSKDMAIAICNKKERAPEFVRPVVCRFLFEEKLVDDRNEIVEKLEVNFSTMPFSIKLVPEFIKENGGTLVSAEVLAEIVTEYTARDIGMMIVQRSAAEVFRGHSLGLTWDGNFDLTDMVVINDEEIRFIKAPVPGGPAQKAKDVHKLGFLFMPMFSTNGKLALYFSVLKEDLNNASEDDVEQDWFVEYILGHPGLRSSSVRYNLLGGIDQSCKRFCYVGSAIKVFLDDNPPWSKDWRSLIPENTTDVFYKTYFYRSEPTLGLQEPFTSTNGGILSFQRKFSRHADIYLKIQDLDEVEKIGGRKFEVALPHIIKILLRDCQMHKRRPLLVHWKPYRDVRLARDGHYHRDGVIGVYPSFW